MSLVPVILYTAATVDTPITTVLLDFGGVLGLPQDPVRIDTMALLCGLPREDFLTAYRQDRLELDRGTLPADEYWSTIMTLGGRKPTPQLIERLEDEDSMGWTRVNEPMVAWSGELRAAGYRTAILSNMPHGKLAFLRVPGSFPWMDEFEAAFFSCQYSMVKPEPAFYQLCLSRLGVTPGESVFLDDSTVNAEGARAVGIHALVYRSAPEAAEELQRVWKLPVRSLRNGTSG